MEVEQTHHVDSDMDSFRDERKGPGKRGRKPSKKSSDSSNIIAKLERSRQSARECRARKKLRYQYLEELVNDREKAVNVLRKEIEMYNLWCQELDSGVVPDGLQSVLEEFAATQPEFIDVKGSPSV